MTLCVTLYYMIVFVVKIGLFVAFLILISAIYWLNKDYYYYNCGRYSIMQLRSITQMNCAKRFLNIRDLLIKTIKTLHIKFHIYVRCLPHFFPHTH